MFSTLIMFSFCFRFTSYVFGAVNWRNLDGAGCLFVSPTVRPQMDVAYASGNSDPLSYKCINKPMHLEQMRSTFKNDLNVT